RTMSKLPAKPDQSTAVRNEDLSIAELLEKVRKLEAENAYLKKLEELEKAKLRRGQAARKKPS
ncbi:hypothetical protein, partial [Pseudomonas putida]